MNNEKNTVLLHRVLRVPVERVYEAFIDADALCRLLPPCGFIGKTTRSRSRQAVAPYVVQKLWNRSRPIIQL